MNDKSHDNWYSMSDKALNETIGCFIKHHRLKQNKSQEEVAQEANISRSTLSLLERGKTVTLATLIQVIRVLNILYVMDVFKVQQEISPIALAKLEKKQRQRASGNKTNKSNKSDW